MRISVSYLVLFVLTLCAPPLHADTWIIAPDSSGDAPTVQAGVDSASPGDTLLLTDGTFSGPGNREIDFLGKGIVVRSQNGASSTTLDGQATHRLFTIQGGEGPQLVIEGLTLTNGFHDEFGGAICCINGSAPTIRACIIENSHTNRRGGGVSIRADSNPAIEGCIIRGNTADEDGAGVEVHESHVTISGCTFERNHGDNGGGLLFDDGAGGEVRDSDFIANHATGRGGGISMWAQSNPSISNCTFDSDTAATIGAAIHVHASAPSIDNVTIRNCVGTHVAGGVAYKEGASGTLSNSLIVGNKAHRRGGGIWMQDSSPTITNTVISDCTAGVNNNPIFSLRGGGINAENSSPVLDGVTVEGCSTRTKGGGIWLSYGSGAEIRNCIVRNNWAGNHAGGIGLQGVNINVTNTVIAGNSADLCGGGVLIDDGASPLIANSLIYENSSGLGGGVSCWGGSTPALRNVTIVCNAAAEGGGIHSRNSTITLESSIVAFSSSGEGAFCESGGSVSLQCSDIYGNVAGDYVGCLSGQLGVDGNISEDPLFCSKDVNDYTISTISPAATSQCGIMGSEEVVNCGVTSVEQSSWSEFKEMFR